MLFMIALALAVCFAFVCRKPMKKHPYLFYIIAAMISVGTILLANSDLRSVPVIVTDYILALFTRGAFATALWCIVMWTGALPNGSSPIKKLMPIRGELSITAALLTLGHNIGFGQTYFVRLFSSRMSSSQIAASILTIIMLVIMLPLTVMSFPQVRRKMNAKLWKKLQRTAYLFYALIYTHVMILCVPLAKMGRGDYFFSIVMYSAVFIGYAVCRVRKWYIVRKKPENIKLLNAVCTGAFVLLAAIALLSARSEAKRTTSDIPTSYTTETAVPVETDTAAEETTESITEGETETAVSDTTESSETTEDTSETTEITSEETTETEAVTEVSEENDVPAEPEQPVQDPVEQPIVPEPEPAPEPEPVYIYRNGTYTASAFGYDGDVEVTVTIENDVILSIYAKSYESDTWYFDSAQGSVISQILATQSTSVDAYSGATYSSNAIMSAVQKALDAARN